LRGLAGFTTGMLLYKGYESGLLKKLFQSDITAVVVIALNIYSLHAGLNDLLCVGLFALLVFTFALNNQRLHKICNWRPGQYLGNISYSIYLTQFFPFVPLYYFNIKLPGVTYAKTGASAGFLTGAGWCLFFIIILIGLSSLSYYYIEKPCRKYI